MTELPSPVADGVARLGAIADITAIALVGSWARESARPDSDIDLIVLTPDRQRLLDRDDWHRAFGEGVELIRSATWGVIEERRLRFADGLVLDVGIGLPAWADIDPLDEGTAAVVRDGMVPLYDPRGILAQLAGVQLIVAPRSS